MDLIFVLTMKTLLKLHHIWMFSQNIAGHTDIHYSFINGIDVIETMFEQCYK